MKATGTNAFLETEKLSKLMKKYAVPCVISLLVAALYNIVDQIFIANASYLGAYGNAANTVVFPLTVVALAIAMMLGDGCCTFVSISLGAKKEERARKGIGNTILCIVAAGIILMLVYLIFQESILTAFGARVNEETFQLSKEYFFWISLGIPFYMFGQAMNPIIRSDGSPTYAMVTLLIGAGLNILFDPICIYILNWGMMGAAVATIFGQIVSAILSFVYLTRMKAVKIRKDSFQWSTEVMKRILPLGITSFLSQISIVLSMAAVLNMVTRYGAMDPIFGQTEYAHIPTAVVGIVMKFFQIVISVAVGLAAGCIPIVGYNIGAGREDRVYGLMKRLLAAEAIVGLIATVIFLAFPYQFTNIFGAKNESIYYTDFAVKTIRIFLCLLPLSCLNKGTFIFLQSLGKAKQSTALSMMREILFGVGLPLLLPVFMGLDGVLFFMPIADILTLIASVVVIGTTRKSLLGKMAERGLSAVAGTEMAMAGVGTAKGTEMTAAGAGKGGRKLTDNNSLTGKGSGSRTADDKKPGLAQNTVITIGRSYGSGGRSIGKLVAEQLHIPFYDAAILEEAAKKSGLSQKYLEKFDEKAVGYGSIYRSVGFGTDSYADLGEMATRAQREIIEKIAAEGPCVIVGRRADQILKDKYNVVSLFISASEKFRIRHVMEREQLSEKAAIKQIRKADRERTAYYSQNTEQKWGVASTYDFCFRTDILGIEETAAAICGILKTGKLTMNNED